MVETTFSKAGFYLPTLGGGATQALLGPGLPLRGWYIDPTRPKKVYPLPYPKLCLSNQAPGGGVDLRSLLQGHNRIVWELLPFIRHNHSLASNPPIHTSSSISPVVNRSRSSSRSSRSCAAAVSRALRLSRKMSPRVSAPNWTWNRWAMPVAGQRGEEQSKQ